MRRCPQVGFSGAKRSTNDRMVARVGGRPTGAGLCGWAGKVAGERGREPVGGFEARAGCLTAEHADLVTQQDEFHVFGGVPSATDRDQGEQPASEGIEGGRTAPDDPCRSLSVIVAAVARRLGQVLEGSVDFRGQHDIQSQPTLVNDETR